MSEASRVDHSGFEEDRHSHQPVFDLSDQLHPPRPEAVNLILLDPHILALGTGRVREDLTHIGIDLNVKRGRVTLLLSHMLSEYMDHTEIDRLPTAKWLLETYYQEAEILNQAKAVSSNHVTSETELNQINRRVSIYETLMEMTDDIAQGTMIVLSKKVRRQFQQTTEPELADIIIRRYYLDVLEHELETPQSTPAFCLKHTSERS